MSEIAASVMQVEATLRQRELDRMKWIAAALFAGAFGLYIAGKVLESRDPAWAYLVAFAEAAMVGALADWFAVVALFRRPLGLPIPHTAIIPRNKRSIGNSLADFVVVQFLSTELIEQRLKNYDAARHLSQWLAASEHRAQAATWLNQVLVYAVKALDDRRIHDFLAHAARNKLQALELSGLIAGGLERVMHDNRHHKILHGGLHRFADYLEDEENAEQVAAFVKGWSEHAWVQSMIEPFIPKIRAAVIKKLRLAAEDENSGLYREFDQQVRSYVSRLQQEGELQEWVDLQQKAMLNHAEFSRQIESLWNEFRDSIVLDMSHPESVVSGKIESLLAEFEQHLLDDQGIRNWLNEQIQKSLIQTANANKGLIGELIREEITRWDDRYMVERLEEYLGRDLQYIRINGTLVGGLFGLLIYAVTMMVTNG